MREARGLKLGSATLKAPSVAGFPPAAEFKPDEAIPVAPGNSGLLLLT